MRRLLSLIVAAAALSLVPITSAWAIWEGNAGIADSTEFPGAGLYARSDMFPKNTIVEIVNLETDRSVRVVITGPSGVPGLVAVLSPETASALNVKSGTVSRVRISVPSVVERPASGTLADSTGGLSDDPDVNPAAAVPASAQPRESAIPLETIAAGEQDPLVAVVQPVDESSPPLDEEPAVVDETVPATEVASPEPQNDSAPADSSAVTSVAEENPANEPELAETPPVESNDAIAEEIAPEPSEETPFEPTAVVSTDDGVAQDSEAADEPSPEPVVDSVASAASEMIAPEAEGVNPGVMAEPELEVAKETPATTAEESPLVYDEPVDALAESEVTLVPAEPNPPAAPDAAESVPIAEPVQPSSIAVAPVPATDKKPEPAATPEPVAEVAPVRQAPSVTPTAGPAPSKLPLVDTLEKGKYYVQLGTYANETNVRSIISSYGAKYPLTVQSTSAKGSVALKVFVGPIGKDETGAVLERFKALGYRDAFVKRN